MTIIVDIIGDCVEVIKSKLHQHINYVYGRQSQILGKLHDMNDSVNFKDGKYPLFAVYMDFPERRGGEYYSDLVLPKIIIATLTVQTNYADVRYDINFKPVLYPIYYEFLHQLSVHPNIIQHDENAIPHTKWDRVGTLPIGMDVTDHVDAIEINNLSITVTQLKLCTNGTN
jgi:hypothetical protein